MSTNQFVPNQRWLVKLSAVVILGLLLLAHIGYGQTQTADFPHVVLQGSIHIQPVNPIPNDQTNKIQPGTPVKLVVTVENKGQQASPSGQLYVRYAFAHPLENEARSVIFETEKKPLPAIAPGQRVDIAFETPHHIPSLLDFVRYDWSIREYQAMAVVDDEEHLIGTLAITFSAYYYPGIKKEFPIKLSK
jgi:hypothetical protein